MLLLSYAVAGRRSVRYANTIAAGALIFALSYLTLEIRRLYHGPLSSCGFTTGAEQYTYSIAWLAFGVVLLGIGIVVNSQRARLASAAVIALTIAKAFLVDMSTLTGVYRALSFICLGWCWSRSAGCTSVSCSGGSCRRCPRRLPESAMR